MLLTKDRAESDPIVLINATYLTELANSHCKITFFRRKKAVLLHCIYIYIYIYILKL